MEVMLKFYLLVCLHNFSLKNIEIYFLITPLEILSLLFFRQLFSNSKIQKGLYYKVILVEGFCPQKKPEIA